MDAFWFLFKTASNSCVGGQETHFLHKYKAQSARFQDFGGRELRVQILDYFEQKIEFCDE